MAKKLSQLHLDPTRKAFFVTGDVVAFYPNVDWAICKKIVRSLLLDSFIATWDDRPDYQRGPLSANEIRWEKEIMFECLDVGNEDLILQFGNKLYRQKRGLAMGVADSPDLANLYGWWFERQVNIHTDPMVPFYGRYIDDCLAIVYANSAQEAHDYMQRQIRFDNCKILWDVDAQYCVFLDMRIYFDEDRKLQHMPFRKLNNHQERIPWISAHPPDVKKGTFLGEMSRLATLSSTWSHYSDSLRSLSALYIHRGYPAQVVKHWLKEYTAKRWQSRLSEPIQREHEETLVLKSEFNIAWQYFQPSKLQEAIFGYWRDYLDRADRLAWEIPEYPSPKHVTNYESKTTAAFFHENVLRFEKEWMCDVRKINIWNNSRIIVSRKRTHNLYDLVNLWKKIVTERAEEMVVEEQRPDAPSHPYALVDPSTLYDPDSPSEENPETNYGLYTVRRQRSSPDRWGASR